MFFATNGADLVASQVYVPCVFASFCEQPSGIVEAIMPCCFVRVCGQLLEISKFFLIGLLRPNDVHEKNVVVFSSDGSICLPRGRESQEWILVSKNVLFPQLCN